MLKNYRQTAGVELHVVADLPALAVEAARHFTDKADYAIKQAGRFTVAFSGGSTPRTFFAELATVHDARLDWRKIHIFWVDERCVPQSDAESNYRMTREHLLNHVSIPSANIHPLRFEGLAEVAARDYENQIRSFFMLAPGALPRFDMLILGIGEDGHTASLFPATAALHETSRLVVSNFISGLYTERLTMTFPTINAAAFILVLASGARKSAIVQTVLNTQPNLEDLPIQGVFPSNGQLLWILDAEAAVD